MIKENFYTVKEVMEITKVKTSKTVYRWLRSGYLPAFKIKNRFYVKETDLKRFLKVEEAN